MYGDKLTNIPSGKYVRKDLCDERTKYTTIAIDGIKSDIHEIKHNHIVHIQESINSIEKTLSKQENDNVILNEIKSILVDMNSNKNTGISKEIMLKGALIILALIAIIFYLLTGKVIGTGLLT